VPTEDRSRSNSSRKLSVFIRSRSRLDDILSISSTSKRHDCKSSEMCLLEVWHSRRARSSIYGIRTSQPKYSKRTMTIFNITRLFGPHISIAWASETRFLPDFIDFLFLPVLTWPRSREGVEGGFFKSRLENSIPPSFGIILRLSSDAGVMDIVFEFVMDLLGEGGTFNDCARKQTSYHS